MIFRGWLELTADLWFGWFSGWRLQQTCGLDGFQDGAYSRLVVWMVSRMEPTADWCFGWYSKYGLWLGKDR
jgi:hypothetical protein